MEFVWEPSPYVQRWSVDAKIFLVNTHEEFVDRLKMMMMRQCRDYALSSDSPVLMYKREVEQEEISNSIEMHRNSRNQQRQKRYSLVDEEFDDVKVCRDSGVEENPTFQRDIEYWWEPRRNLSLKIFHRVYQGQYNRQSITISEIRRQMLSMEDVSQLNSIPLLDKCIVKPNDEVFFGFVQCFSKEERNERMDSSFSILQLWFLMEINIRLHRKVSLHEKRTKLFDVNELKSLNVEPKNDQLIRWSLMMDASVLPNLDFSPIDLSVVLVIDV